jgi:hypothetical protein
MNDTKQKEETFAFTTTVQVLEGRGLAAKDPNGLSDPYCIIGVANAKDGKDEFLDLKACTTSEVLMLLLLLLCVILSLINFS